MRYILYSNEYFFEKRAIFMKLLDVKNLCIDLNVGKNRVPVVRDVSFSVNKGEIMALVGESGCGKSLTNLSLARLLDEKVASIRANSIEVMRRGEPFEIISANKREMRSIRGGTISYIFQEPAVSLNPVLKIQTQIAEVLRLHRKDVKNEKEEIIRLLNAVGIVDPAARLNAYPHELSGGMQQRIMIAMALAAEPELLIADEPTTALDVTIQAQILELIKRLCKERDMGVILVTHNWGIVAQRADYVAIMYAGMIVEKGRTVDIITNPRHPYTKKLLSTVPILGQKLDRLPTIPGTVPAVGEYPLGCRFYGRCGLCNSLSEEAQNCCKEIIPDEFNLDDGRFIRCHAIKKELGK